MPPFKQVVSLQTSTLRRVAYLIRRLCCDHSLLTSDLIPVIDHLQTFLPPQIQASVCHTLLHESHKIVFPELLNQKYIYICTQLHAEFIWINDSRSIVPMLEKMDGQSVRTLKMTGSHGQLDLDLEYSTYDFQQFMKLEPLYRFLRTLTNLTTLKCSQMCNNFMLQLLSRTCPHLEEVNIEMCTDVDDEGVFYLGGHFPSHDTYSQIRRGVRIPSKSVCTKLRKVNLEYTLACTASAVMLLHLCRNIEELMVTPDVNIGDVFTTLHGTNPEKYEEVTTQYSLRILHTYMELDENVLSLIVKTCPRLHDVTLRCNGVERKDRNFLATLLSLNLKTLNVMNCSMPALLWYLDQCGSNLRSLTIQHLTMAPLSLTFTRTHLQNVIRTCPNLQSFTLKLNNSPIQPDVPYSAIGSRLLYFKSLSHLTLEGTTITSEDLSVLVSKCESLRELHILIHNLDMLEDQVLYDLLATGAMHNLWTLFLHRPMLTLAGLKRLLVECPHLHTIGPLSSWAISKKDREELSKEIRMKNWDLNVESPEMMHMFIL
ncbi:uncharacterized protein LOC121878441 [Homarus americanus]|uniref:Uncharacterized protein n=1 Tax=Homarus americanus TaxID=6706 RepID=A0A8J5JQ78_HOMAM|nr:uncharacterized protein LOC121878441 [Homarus americanus]KAG7158818.1 hypothetical protein Hamer_G011502 [Homarus americanus]